MVRATPQNEAASLGAVRLDNHARHIVALPAPRITAKDAAGTEDAYAWAMRVKFAILLTLAAMGACGPSDSGATQGDLADPSVTAKLRALALQASSANGVPSPKTMIAVYSPDDEAAQEIISGDIVNDHVPVYVIEVTGGSFTCNSCSVPPGASPPQGNALTITVNAQTFQVTDFGITPNVPDLTKISPDVVNLAQ